MFTFDRRKLYSVKQAAKFLSRSDDYVRRLCRDGLLLAKKNATGEWRIEQKSVRDYRRSQGAREVPNRVGTFSSALIFGAVSVIFIVIVQTIVRPLVDLDGPTRLTLYFLLLSTILAVSFFMLYARYRRRSFLRVFYASLTTIVLITFSISFAEAIARSFLQASSGTVTIPPLLSPATDPSPIPTVSRPPEAATALATGSRRVPPEKAVTPLPPEQEQLESLFLQVTDVRAPAEALTFDSAEENERLDVLQATTEALVMANSQTESAEATGADLPEESTPPAKLQATADPFVLQVSTTDESTPLRFTLESLAMVITLALAVLTAMGGTIGWIFSQYFKVLEFRLKEQEIQLRRLDSRKSRR
jgi:hypothetical protein